MHEITLLVVLIVGFALIFDYINGFHDTANAIATVVSTRVMHPRMAILMAAGLNFVGALMSTKVAHTIASGLVHESGRGTGHASFQLVVLAAVLGAIVWNLITWRFGLPSSSSHALIGGLVGATIVHGGAELVQWAGLKNKVLLPLVLSPLTGFFVGFLLMMTIYRLFHNANPHRVGNAFRRLQILSAASMAFTHGMNDAQKSMGIITLALFSVGLIPTAEVPKWVMIACAVAMALGTSAGGWRIMKTMGHRIIRLEPVNGFAAETAAAATIFMSSHWGMPVSTTHCIAGSIFGVGTAKRFSAVNWTLAREMVWAWVLTIPAAGAVAALSYLVLRKIGV